MRARSPFRPAPSGSAGLSRGREGITRRRFTVPLLAGLLVTTVLSPFARAADAPTESPSPTPPVLQMPPPDPARIFAPLAWPDPVNAFRSGSGRRGPEAWQNRADYDIHVAIDPISRVLSGDETITYTNNSPDDLDVLWVHLDQNAYREGARANFATPAWHTHHTDGVTIESVTIEQEEHDTPIVPVISDTRMQLPLVRPLHKGEKYRLRIVWHLTLPGAWGGRTAVSPSQNGDIYEVAQFYPRMAVYDDLRGWDTLPGLGQEFYLETGNFDYSVTVPSDFIVAGSGALVNADDVLTREQRDRLTQAARSEQRVMIRTRDEVLAAVTAELPAPSPAPKTVDKASAHKNEPAKSTPPAPKTKTWRFHMNDTRDVAFAASAAFLWDAARLDIGTQTVASKSDATPRLAMAVYPVEAMGSHGWDRAVSYVKHAIEDFSTRLFPYPWPNAVAVGGHGANMEYPGLAFEGKDEKDGQLFAMTVHEFAHQWFPMLVGSNERRNAFMDEGFATFLGTLAAPDFNQGEFAPKRDAEFAPTSGRPATDITALLRDPAAPVLMAPSDTVPETYRHPLTYFKAAYGLTLLREQIIGPERFDRAFRAWIMEWAYHHPTPSDFFRFMSSETGEDLSWFWRGWFFNNWAPDYAVAPVTYPDDDPAKGALVKVVNRGWLPLPVTLQVTWKDGSSARVRIPTEAWVQHNELTVEVAGNQPVRTAIVDPDLTIPDIDRSNNSFGAILTVTPPTKAGP